MSLLHLRTFLEAYRQRSLTEAARVLGLTQPAVSQQIASLEAQVGRPLFDRHARGVRPTTVADDLAANLGQTLDVAEAALSTARARSTRLSGTLHLAAPADFLAECGAVYLKVLVDAGLELRLHTGGQDHLYAMLLDDRVHLALTASQPADPRLAFERLGSEQLMAVASPAVANRILQANDLARALDAEPYLVFDLDQPLLRSWLAANGLPPPSRVPAVTAPDLGVLSALLCLGLGWSVLPAYLTARQREAGELIEIPAPVVRPENAYNLVWAKAALRHPRIVFARDILVKALRNR